jgi:pyruvate/2-oxoglutarate dehydrogenase complex dihydrolipoamide dehydrogenase (E3) component
MDDYDVIVIGTGTAAQVVSSRVRRALIAFKRTFTDPVPKKREESFAKQGIDAFHGMARFSGPDTGHRGSFAHDADDIKRRQPLSNSALIPKVILENRNVGSVTNLRPIDDTHSHALVVV